MTSSSFLTRCCNEVMNLLRSVVILQTYRSHRHSIEENIGNPVSHWRFRIVIASTSRTSMPLPSNSQLNNTSIVIWTATSSWLYAIRPNSWRITARLATRPNLILWSWSGALESSRSSSRWSILLRLCWLSGTWLSNYQVKATYPRGNTKRTDYSKFWNRFTSF